MTHFALLQEYVKRIEEISPALTADELSVAAEQIQAQVRIRQAQELRSAIDCHAPLLPRARPCDTLHAMASLHEIATMSPKLRHIVAWSSPHTLPGTPTRSIIPASRMMSRTSDAEEQQHRMGSLQPTLGSLHTRSTTAAQHQRFDSPQPTKRQAATSRRARLIDDPSDGVYDFNVGSTTSGKTHVEVEINRRFRELDASLTSADPRYKYLKSAEVMAEEEAIRQDLKRREIAVAETRQQSAAKAGVAGAAAWEAKAEVKAAKAAAAAAASQQAAARAAAEAAEAAALVEAAVAAEAAAFAVEAIRHDMKRRDAEAGMAEMRQQAAVNAASAAAETAAAKAAEAAKLANSARARADKLRLEAHRQRGEAAGRTEQDESQGVCASLFSPASSTLIGAATPSASSGREGSPRPAESPIRAIPIRDFR